ncbi:TonB-dependent receptor [Arcicella lustrica]|uniref:TonB-dependent receptor n=1 Tax=Arcicella lustrica TaxID=2984196 RepID=A0ABU5SEM9_9BACT|nr:TonB-dependent receptor [Arcicella sp. DC25W]MEA5425740.1 TonB-dependent receptor [Arcicella sp. DC25W]
MKKIFLLTILAMLGFRGLNYAQDKTLTGKVKDAKDGSVLAGASVVAKGTSIGTVTNSLGEFTLKVPVSVSVLTVSFIGYASKDVPVGTGVLNVSLDVASNQLEEVVISTGSRNSKRTMTDTPLPIDILSAADLKTTGQTSFDKALQYRVPSFNTVNTPVNDATSLLDPYEIRNMGPSRTLILINGKRKNTSALMYIQTSPGRGESGADISAIPQQAIKRVEILRDGASAQYGSDAIAGVMNIILKDKFDYGSATLTMGVTAKGDGKHIGFSVNNGSNFEKGYINYTIDFSRTTLANRPGTVSAEAEADASLGFDAPLAQVKSFLALKPDAGNINGQPENTAAKFLVNGGYSVGEKAELYYTAAYVYKRVNSFANYRTPYWRPTDNGLLTPAGQPYLGYVPTFQGDLNDYTATIGVKSETNGWKTDLSFTTGGNKQLYTVSNSVNRSLGKGSPTYFKPGGYEFSHNVGNIDVSKQVNDKLSLSFGSEFRAETFTVFVGDTSSYVGSGADSFPGTTPNNAGTNTRFNFGGYVDLGYDITDEFLVNGTLRSEHYSDFGDATVYKISSRYKFSDKVTLRGSYSTGFRAPLLHQIYQQQAQASFVPGQGIQTKGVVNNVSPQAFALGVPKLTPEKSTNFTVGLGLNPTKNLSVTLDYYNIKVKDRIVLGSEIAGTDAGNTALDNILTSNGIVAVSFFANALNTTTSGLDFVVSQKNIELGMGKLGINLAGNYTFENKYTSINNPKLIADAGKSIFDRTQDALLFSSRPKYKVILGFDYLIKGININLNNTLFGKTRFHQNGLDANTDTEFTPAVVSDLAISIPFSSKTTFTFNVNNVLNVLPKWDFIDLKTGAKTRYDANNNVPSAKYYEQYNLITFNGRYSRVTYDGSQFSQLGTIFNASLNIKF